MTLAMKRGLIPSFFFTLPVKAAIGLVSDGLLADLVSEGSSSSNR